MPTNVMTWLDFAVQQMAAESYLDQFVVQGAQLQQVLADGNNDRRVIPLDQFTGKTRFTNLQAQQFVQRYQIIDHHANDATGFSATLMRDTQTGEYTLSFRSTESAPAMKGGDSERDLFGADAEISASGFAFGQLAAMEEYLARLKQGIKSDGSADSTLQTFFATAGHTLNVTGFSLGGHLATVFTELHASEVNHTYIFNGAGRGHVPGALPGLSAEENRIQDMLTYFRSVLDNPDNAIASFPRTSVYDQAKTLYEVQGASWHPFDQGSVSLYNDPRYQWAKEATQVLFSPNGLMFLQSPGEVQEQGPFAKITQLYGQATTDDLQFVANSGVHAPAIPVFIEGQPLIAGLPFPSFTESGNTHSITLIVDSFAVQELIQMIDSRYGQASAELLIKAASNSKADTVAPLDTPDVVERDSLEKTVEAFHKLFRESVLASADPLPINSRVGGFGDLANRNVMYTAIQEITDRVETMRAQGLVFTLTDLTDPDIDRATLLAHADTNTAEGLAYRYALKELNPFVVTTDTEFGTNALYTMFNAEGELDLYDPTTGAGTLTASYLDDRAAFLREKIALNELDRNTSLRSIHYLDVASGYEIKTDAIFQTNREFLFGSDNAETLTGHNKGDALYGGDGVDTIFGNGGNDYLQGDTGNDMLDGGTGVDRMLGGRGNDTYIVDDLGDQVVEGAENGRDTVQSAVNFTLRDNVEDLTLTGTDDLNGEGNELDNLIRGNVGVNRLEGHGGSDHLIGNGGNDVLAGGTGDNDLLEGDVGFDTYIYNAGDGFDRIEDSDAQGQIIFNGHRLLGGIHNSDDSLNIYKSLDGLTTYVLVGTDLIVNGVLTVNENFQSGQFGIELDDLSNYPRDNGPPTGPWTNTLIGTDVSEDIVGVFMTGPLAVFGNGGNDDVIGRSASGGDLIDGGLGDDLLVGRAFLNTLPDYLIGGDGNDFAYLNAQEVFRGGEGDDVGLTVGSIIYTTVSGRNSGPVYMDGEAGDDQLNGTLSGDVLKGGDGNDILRGENMPAGWIARLADNNDTLSNWIEIQQPQEVFSANGGADFFDGGAGDDLIVGDGGNDIMSGGPGNDRLYGDDETGYRVEPGDDFLDGGEGDDLLRGGNGNDSLSGGAGVDLLYGDLGDDILDGGDDADTMFGGDGSDELYGGAGDDVVVGDGLNNQSDSGSAGGDDFLDGGDGNDVLQGGVGADILLGGAGNDVLFGQDQNDTLFGDEGNDELQGMDGNDLLSGDVGNDRLFGQEGDDTLYGDEGDDTLSGGDGNDILVGGDGFNILSGGHGDDQLIGGQGFDGYFFGLGDGHDTITDTVLKGAENVIQFGAGISFESLTFLHDPLQQTLTIQVSGSDSITLLGFDPRTLNYVVDTLGFGSEFQVSLADRLPLPGGLLEGSDEDNVIRSGSGDDTIFAGSGNDSINAGAGNDVILGEEGNDFLAGGAGADRYVFNPGDGIDTVSDTPGEGNRLIFGSGISSANLGLGFRQVVIPSGEGEEDPGTVVGYLVLRTEGAGEAVEIGGFDPTNQSAPLAVEQFTFADGTILTSAQLLARGLELVGTAAFDTLDGQETYRTIRGVGGNDTLIGGSIDNVLEGGDGNDVLFGNGGIDRLSGGTGDDVLRGGLGDDAYLFGPGSGQDKIVERQGSEDAIRFAAGVVPSDVIVMRENNDLVLKLNGGADRLTVSQYFAAPSLQIELVQFADGTVWDQTFFDNLVPLTTGGTARADVLVGTSGDDRLLALSGDDQLIGLVGNDQLDGGTGADQLIGGSGDDMYIVDDMGDVVTELANEGVDTVRSSVTRTLETNVENLVLTGVEAINGTGNELENILTGNSASNVLTGGLGNDTYIVSANDAIVESAGEGTDTVQTDHNAALGDNLENLTLMGSVSLTGKGNALDNVLRADGAISVLAGGDGNDTYMLGSNGDDDILVETLTGGIDTAIASHDYRLPAYIENLTLLDPRIPDFATFSLIPYRPSDQSVAGYGNELNNTLVGGRANNVLDGGLGADTMIGGDGDDVYFVDHAGDIVVEQMNEGIDSVQSSVSYSLSENVENLMLSGSASIDGTGNALNNEVRGNQAANVLDGGPGNDSLQGFGGTDTYLFGRGSGRDTVFDSATAGEIDTIQFDSAVTADDVEVYRNGFNLELAIHGTTDELALLSFFDSPGYDQKQVRFADDTVWSSAELSAQAAIGTTITGSFENETISGSDGHDLLIGSAGNDVLMGGRGKDTLYGDVTFQPSFGNQVIGDDTLIGGPGDDTLTDFRGTNLFDGGPGNDTLTLGTGVDTVVFGRGAGVDVVVFDNNRIDIDVIQVAANIAPADVVMTWRSASSADLVISDSGDRLALQLSTDWFAVGPETTQAIVRFGDGTEWSLAWSSNNVGMATATSGDDVLGAAFPAVLAGLQGNDTYLLGSSGISGNYGIAEAPGEGIDTVQSLFDYVLDPQVENLILAESRSSVLRNPERGTGNELDNLIIGNTGDNLLDGGNGNDVLVGGVFRSVEELFVFETGSDILIGGGGDDVLMADSGNIVFSVDGVDSEWLFFGGGSEFRHNVPRLADDLLIGGVGNDTYIIHSQEQTVVELENEGIDTVRSTVSYMLGEQLENLALLSPPVIFDSEDNIVPPPPLNGTGNELDNVLIGSEDANVLSGLAGRDTLAGQLGNDRLRGGAGHDTYLFNLGDGIDTIEDISAVGEGNRIQFGVGISRSDLLVTHDEVARTLTIQAGGRATDKLVLTNFDPTNANGSLVMETVAFADGSTASLLSLLGGPVNHAPTLANPLVDQTAIEETALSIPVPANAFADEDAGDTLVYSATLADGSTLPVWLNFDATTRTFIGTPDDAQVGRLDLTVTATDRGSLRVADTFILTVTNVNDVPTVAAPLPDQTALEDTSFSFVVPISTFADVDQIQGDTVTYSATLAGGTALPTWLSFDSTTRTFSGTPLNEDVGTLDLTVTATDAGNLSAVDRFTITVTNVNDAPTVASPIADQLADSGATFTFTVPSTTFADVDAGDQLIYSATLVDGSILPLWLRFDPATHTFIGTPADSDAGLFSLRITATDGGNLSVSDEFDVAVAIPDQVLTGTSDNDRLTGGAGHDQLFGLGGEDTLNGAVGDDVLDGGPGNDTMVGGTGNDTYIVDAADDVVTESPNEGRDTVQSALRTYTLGANIENLTLIGTGPSTGIGNALNNQLTGNSGANLLDGKGGADTMVGGGGNDLYVVDQAGDIVTEATNEGFDTISSFVTYSLGANVENLVLTGSVSVNGTGNDLDNTLTGNSGANVLMGSGGNDIYVIGAGDTVIEVKNNGTDTVVSSLTHTLAANVENLTLVGFNAINGTGNGLDNVLNGLLNLAGNTLTGGAGDDTYVVGSGDRVVEAAGGGTDTVQTSMTHTLGANVENLTLTGTGAINGTGNELHNTLIGNSANNTLSGGGGNDTLRGGLGNDVLIGGTGNDTFLFSRGEGQDVARDSSGTSDLLQFDATIDSLDLVISRQANDLRLAVHGSSDQMTVHDWYLSTNNRIETIQAGDGDALLSTQVDQLIQAMATFTKQTGLIWDQAIDQQPQAVQAVLAASWQ